MISPLLALRLVIDHNTEQRMEFPRFFHHDRAWTSWNCPIEQAPSSPCDESMQATYSSSLRKNLETEPMFSQVRVDFWRWIELWSLRSAVDYAATSLGMRIRL